MILDPKWTLRTAIKYIEFELCDPLIMAFDDIGMSKNSNEDQFSKIFQENVNYSIKENKSVTKNPQN